MHPERLAEAAGVHPALAVPGAVRAEAEPIEAPVQQAGPQPRPTQLALKGRDMDEQL